MVHIASPNNDELAGYRYYGVEDPLDKSDPDTIESLVERL